jgi:hypothetical protein
MIGSASGKLNWLFSFGIVSLEVIIEELSSIVAIKTKEGKGEFCFDQWPRESLLQTGRYPII